MLNPLNLLAVGFQTRPACLEHLLELPPVVLLASPMRDHAEQDSRHVEGRLVYEALAHGFLLPRPEGRFKFLDLLTFSLFSLTLPMPRERIMSFVRWNTGRVPLPLHAWLNVAQIQFWPLANGSPLRTTMQSQTSPFALPPHLSPFMNTLSWSTFS